VETKVEVTVLRILPDVLQVAVMLVVGLRDVMGLAADEAEWEDLMKDWLSCASGDDTDVGCISYERNCVN
jgi:hypothetical protein